MKKQLFFLLLILFSFRANSQNCNFTYSTNPGTTLVSFAPNPSFPVNQYLFSWDFGDGNTSTQATPTHAYNSPMPVFVCCTISDVLNNIVCVSCDSVSYQSSTTCSFNYFNQSPSVFTFQNLGSPGYLAQWDMGNGSILFGDFVTYTYTAPGNYIVCLSLVDSSTSTVYCTSCQTVTVVPNNCFFTATSNPASNSTFDFTATATSGAIYNWDFGDGTTGTGAQVSHTYSSPGTYVVTVIITDVFGAICTFTDIVVVGNQSGICNFSFTPYPNTLNSFEFNAFRSTPAPSSTTISWDFGDGSTGTGDSITHSYVNGGNFLVCMYESDSTGVVICSSCNMVTAGQVFGCNITASTNPLNSLTIDYSVIINSAVTSVLWDFGDGSTGTGFNPSHTYTVAGTYLVVVQTNNSSGVICSSSQWVTVSTGGSGNCLIAFAPDSGSTNSFTFALYVNSPSSTVIWDFNDGSMGTGDVVSHVFATPGVYQVCAIERDTAQNIICQTCVTVTVGIGPTFCQSSFFATTLGLDAYFIDLSLGNNSATTYAWDFGDNTTSAVRFPQHTYTNPGTYMACLTVTSGNCVDQFCSPVTVDTIPGNPSGGCQAFFATVQLAPYQVSIVNLSSGLNLNFLWDFGDGTSDNQPYPSHYYTTTGNYNLCLTVSDANGCTSTYCDTLSVDSLGNVFKTLQGFTINILSPSMLTGVNEIQSPLSFRAYPNPASSEIHLSVTSSSEKVSAYRILSLQGSEVLVGSLNGFDGVININGIAKGTYLLEVTFNSGTRSYQSIIKN